MTLGTTTHRSEEMPCDRIAAQGVAERYLSGQLEEQEQAAFELHYFECERCFSELRALEVMPAGLRQSQALPDEHASRPFGWRGWLGAAAAVMLAAFLGLWMTRTGRETDVPRTSGRSDAAIPSGEPPPPDTPAPISLAELARFDPPSYVTPVLRGPEDDARRSFRTGMTHYERREYRTAIDELRKASSLDASAADAGFFLGVSLLLAGDPTAGMAELRRTIALGPSPYLEEAYLYLSKGLLQTGEVSAARQALERMVALGGDHQPEGKTLLGQLDRAAPGRP